MYLGVTLKEEKEEKVLVRKFEDTHDIELCLEDIVKSDEKLKNVKKEIEECMLNSGKKA